MERVTLLEAQQVATYRLAISFIMFLHPALRSYKTYVTILSVWFTVVSICDCLGTFKLGLITVE